MASGRNAIFQTGILLAVGCLATVAVGKIVCPTQFALVGDPDNCRNYVQCVFWTAVVMPCPNGMAFSSAQRPCVKMELSDCTAKPPRPKPVLLTYPTPPRVPASVTATRTKPTTDTTREPTTDTTTPPSTKPTTKLTDPTTERAKPVVLQRSIADQCQRNPRAKIPHPTNCAQYYDCSVIYKSIPKYYEQFLVECPYPELFSERSLRCDNYNRVKCGRRKVAKEPCEYIQNWCQTANCRPCSSRFPTCSDKTDGVNPWRQREWTPYFVRCFEGRLMDQGICEHSKGFPTLFSPESRSCVSIFSVPKKFGGSQPDCRFRRNGFYADEKGDCQKFFQCQDNEYWGEIDCPSNHVFDSGVCKDPARVTGRCGRSAG